MNIEQVALQLYTLRHLCQDAAGLASTAGRVRQAGYRAVQVSGVGPIPAPEIRSIMDDHGLVICATHEPADMILQEPERVADRLDVLGCPLTAFPFPGTRDLSDPATLDRLIKGLEQSGSVLRRRGKTLGYHNHAIEFMRVGSRTVLERIFEGTSPDCLVAELDSYWVQFGGGNMVEWCTRMKGRLPFVHLKDYRINARHQPTWCEIGEGVLPMRAIVDSAEASGCRWFIVEQDTTEGDPFECIRVSFDAMSRLASIGTGPEGRTG